LTKGPGKRSRKNATGSRSLVKRRPSSRSTKAKSRNKSQNRRATPSSRTPRNRRGNRKKRH
jgi:hypothetical protein